MRDMNVRHLCPICKEALWENLLLSENARSARTSLIHGVKLHISGGAVHLQLNTAPLGQWRASRRIEGEALHAHLAPVSGGRPRHTLRSKRRVFETTIPRSQMLDVGCWLLQVRLETPDVRRFEVVSEICFCAQAGRAVHVMCVPCSQAEQRTTYVCPAPKPNKSDLQHFEASTRTLIRNPELQLVKRCNSNVWVEEVQDENI